LLHSKKLIRILLLCLALSVLLYSVMFFYKQPSWVHLEQISLHTQVLLHWQAPRNKQKVLKQQTDSILTYFDSVFSENQPIHPFYRLARCTAPCTVDLNGAVRELWEYIESHPAISPQGPFSPLARAWLEYHGLLENTGSWGGKKPRDSVQHYKHLSLLGQRWSQTGSQSFWIYQSGKLISLVDSLQLTLGSCSKGYAVRGLARYLDAQGIQNYLVAAAGDMQFKGLSYKEKPWVIGVKHPRKGTSGYKPDAGSALLGIYTAHNPFRRGFSTSGDYERYVLINQKRIHHLIDMRTGLPQGDKWSLSISAQDALEADLLASLLFIYPVDSLAQLVQKVGADPNTKPQLLYMDSSEVLYVSEGLRKDWTSQIH